MMLKKVRIVGSVVILAALGPGCVSPVDGDVSTKEQTQVPTLAARGTAVIDGMKGSEWDGAASTPVFGGPWEGAVFYVMNDDENLYLALETASDTELDPLDIVRVRFDGAGDGVTSLNEDGVVLYQAAHRDTHRGVQGWSVVDSSEHGEGSVSFTGGGNFFELSRPLDSGDPQDIAVELGHVLGVCLIFADNGTSYSSFTVFPAGCDVGGEDQTGYQSVMISPPEGNEHILSMDDSTTWNSPAIVGSSSDATQGSASLAVEGQGWTVVRSDPLTGLASAPSTFSVDLRMPTETPNPWWRGDLVVVLNAPSAGIYSAQVGSQSLSSAPLGAFSTMSFSISAYLANQLTQEIEDLTVDVILNVPDGDAVYLLDNARFE